MAKGNIFMGTLNGSVGDVTFMRRLGKQVSRARVRVISNPKSIKQRIARIVLGTVGRAYTLMNVITNHSFGLSGKARNQARFQKVNLSWLRRVAISQLEGSEMVSNFLSSAVNPSWVPAAQYIVSEGSLRAMGVSFVENSNEFVVASTPLDSTSTYRDVINALGLQPGDQLSFMAIMPGIEGDEANHYAGPVEVARVVLLPASGNLDVQFLQGSGGVGEVADANPLNEGKVEFDLSENLFGISSMGQREVESFEILALGVIVSREVSAGKWAYSTCQLVYGPNVTNEMDINEALVQNEQAITAESDNYLDNAQEFGTGETIVPPITPGTTSLISVNAFGSGSEPIGAEITPDADGIYQIPSGTTNWFFVVNQQTSYSVTPSGVLTIQINTTSAAPNVAYGCSWAGSAGYAEVNIPQVGLLKFQRN